MTESTAPQTSRPICPWCSAELRTGTETSCPSCGATLVGEGPSEAALPGVTAIDAEAIVRGARSPVPERRSRLLGWITGEEAGEPETPAAPGSLEPPPPEVRREMLRMELEAEVAELQAEVGALAAEAREAGLDEEEQALEAVADDAAELHEDVTAAAEDVTAAAEDVTAVDEDVAPTAGAGSTEDRPPA